MEIDPHDEKWELFFEALKKHGPIGTYERYQSDVKAVSENLRKMKESEGEK